MPTYTTSLNSNFDLKIVVTLNSQSTSNNSSNVSAALQIIKKGSGIAWQLDPVSYTFERGGLTTNSSTTYDFRNSSSKTIQNTGGETFVHDSDGTRTIRFYGYFSGGSGIPAGSVVGNYTPPRIARASKPRVVRSGSTVTRAEVGQTVTVYSDRASSTFIHNVVFQMGSYEEWISSNTDVGNSKNWTISMSALYYMTNQTSRSGTIKMVTRDGSSGPWLGSETMSFRLDVPSNITPNPGTLSVTELNSSVPTGLNKFVQGVSRLRVALSGESGTYGSSIDSYVVRVGDEGFYPTKSHDYDTPIRDSGTIEAVGRVYDSRGRTDSVSKNIEVLPYEPPKLSNVKVERVNSAGTPTPEGTRMKVTVPATITSLKNGTTEYNSGTVKVYSRVRGTTSWSLVQTKTFVAGAAPIVIQNTTNYPTTTSYDVLIEVVDVFATSAVQSVLSTAAVTMFWGPTGVGVGKYPTLHALEVGGTIQADGRILPLVQGLTTQNLDTIIEDGDYTQNSNANATTTRNYPAPYAGRLEVVSSTTKGFVYQTYTTFQSTTKQIWTRTKYNGTWYAWVQISVANTAGFPFAMAAGTHNFGSSSQFGGEGTTITVPITFPAGRFTAPPVVTLSGSKTYGRASFEADEVTTSGFNAIIRRNALSWANGWFRWQAIQMTSLTGDG